MVPLPKLSPTAEAIFSLYERRSGDWRRPHLGASVIGSPCERALWYGFRWVTPPSVDPSPTSKIRRLGQLLRLFERGKREEEWLIDDLRKIGCEVHDVDPTTGKQIRFVELGGHFSGSCDGVIRGIPEAPDKWHVLEVKTSNAKQFAKVESFGVEEAKPQHWAQMQCYMLGLDLDRALYAMVCKDDDRIHVERVRLEKRKARAIVEKARRVIFSPVPPTKLSDDPSWWECKLCAHAPTCHYGEVDTIGRSCRTCSSATPREDGTWWCEYHGRGLSVEEQKAGCGYHLYIPQLLPWDPIEHSEKDWSVTYLVDESTKVIDSNRELTLDVTI